MSVYLGLQSGGHLLLVDGSSGLLLEAQDEFDVTFPLLTSELVVTLDPWQGTTFPLLRVRLLGGTGEVNELNVTFPLWFSVLGNPAGSFSTTFGLINVNLYGYVAIPVGSGIYQLIDGETHDVYYTNPALGTGTTSNAIPEPHAQTYLASDDEQNFIHLGGVRYRVVGAGTLKTIARTMDSIRSEQLANITLVIVTNKEQTILSNLSARRLMIDLYTENIDELFEFNRIILFIKPIFTQKPM